LGPFHPASEPDARRGWRQACYTAGARIPRPVNAYHYFHRSIDPKKLIAIRFSSLRPKQKLKDVIRQYALPPKPTIPGLKPLEERHCEEACQLLTTYLNACVNAA
jgi:glycylpeptide N-tetradecanoyltransferase